MITREATEQDLEILLTFEQGIVSAERPFNSTFIDGEIHYYDLSHFITSPDATLIVVEENNEIVASGYALIRQSEKNYYKFENYAYLGFMYVKPEYRGRGINKIITDELINWARSRNIQEIRLDVYAENESAIKAYEKAGFEPHLLTMRLKS
ncbi:MULTISPECIES: GNAT family N-acetyltransferase [Chryseobacterium]|uniref:GNAT family N-acetyltransferase n=1 Tax=Chryseobacterium bernardetii TaxID=1241978 RepID=A0A3G6TA86_9FLAO|nr:MULTISPECIES: GNAT family N-acetyltransferase [Chryseobacterium]AZB23526.1 GNAT family N-acetyltransferase [Chryseobacterium bernardetii]AZB34207.1 GNAT family N-acetyltransferase [Chryseobacterium bernardetii]UCA57841.1 GNAT family N-acetyltransferase [Chryseobacterium rhizoplanae]